eukprot:314690_1
MGIVKSCKTCGCDSVRNIEHLHKYKFSARNSATPIPSNTTNNDTQMDDLSCLIDDKTMQLLLYTDDDDDFSPKSQNDNDNLDLFEETSTKIIPCKTSVKLTTTDQNHRLTTIIHSENILELQNKIQINYRTDSDEDSTTSDSSMDTEEFLSLQNIHSEKRKIKGTKANIYRQNTSNRWGIGQLDDLHKEMSEQLAELSRHVSSDKIEELHKNNELSQNIFVPSKILNYNSENEKLPNANLFRDGSSEKWNKTFIDKQKLEMQKEMLHLVTTLQNPQIDKHDSER